MRSLIVMLLCMSCLTTIFRLAKSTDHTVGGQDGWDVGVDIKSWADNEKFSAGDNLIFSYQPFHDVLEVSEQHYESCTTTNAFSKYTGGSTTIQLKSSGTRYFICGVSRHCSAGMKLQVDVLPSTSTSPPPSSSPPSPVYSPPPQTASPPPPSPIYSSPSPIYSSPSPIYSLPPPSTASPPASLTTYYYSSPPPPLKTSSISYPPESYMAPGPAPKHHKHKKSPPPHAHAPKKAHAPKHALGPTVRRVSSNYNYEPSNNQNNASPDLRSQSISISMVLAVVGVLIVLVL